jgi:hypothetical protein
MLKNQDYPIRNGDEIGIVVIKDKEDKKVT